MFRKFLLKVAAGALAFTMALALPVMTIRAEGNKEHKEKNVAQVLEEKDYAVTTYTSTCGNYKYSINDDGTVTIKDYLGTDKEIIVPAQLDGYTVSTIGKSAFYGVYSEKIEVSEGITYILERAFSNCYYLEAISIPASVTYIAEDAFWDRRESLVVTLAEANQSYKVENNAIVSADGKILLFYTNKNRCENYTISDGVEKICPYAFVDCIIDNLVISDSVTEIGEGAFKSGHCDTITPSKNLVTIKEDAFYFSYIKHITIPASVKEIERWAFAWSKLETVTIEEGVEILRDYSFYNTCLSSVTIPASVTVIEEASFSDCEYLAEIVVSPASRSFKVIDDALYTYDGKTMIAYATAKTSDTYIIPAGVEIIMKRACSNAKNLVSVIVPEGVKRIDNEVFIGCDLLKEIQLPHSIESLGTDLFWGCASLEAVVLPGKLTDINYNLFSDCTSLKSVFIPSEVTRIKDYAFENCTSLTDIYFVGSEAEWAEVEIGEDRNDAIQTATIHYLGNLRDFVSRMYSVALGREYDAVGLNGWVQHLIEETHDGAGLAKEFVLGPEFALRNLTDEQYVDTLYTTFFNRQADAAGKQLWLATLTNGGTREYVLSQFVNLDEFTILCSDYDINRGVMFPDGSVAAPGLPQFVSRLYDEVLGRGADSDGLYNWTAALATKAVTAEEAAVNFFMSQEYEMKNVDSTTFVIDCYSVFMDREADADGLAYWVSCLDDYGVSREWVISEFAKSAEFKEIAAKYGL